ncbi:MAG: hypothetical protein OEN56_11420 [Gemmatimonadota bacterium]|nr:hypothetical protein [Gemmatimonadota bacterium]
MKQPHFEHQKEHLERVRDGYPPAARLGVRWIPFLSGTASREGLIPVA